MSPAPHLYIIAGPTGVGKTGLAVRLAREWNTEIISADSMQIYRQLSIGTARPAPEECGDIPYRLVNCVNIDEKYDLFRYISEADALIANLKEKGRKPIIVGGTGLYIKGLIEGVFEQESKNEQIRAELVRRMNEHGLPFLYEELGRVDPAAHARIKPRDHQRILRALEVYYTTGAPITQWQESSRRTEPRYPHTLLVLIRDRGELYDRIDARVDAMFAAGLLDEVRGILSAGYSPDLHPLKALGYREMIRAIKEEWSFAKALEEMKKATRRYAKRQLTWFRGMPQSRWLNISGYSEEDALSEIMRCFA